MKRWLPACLVLFLLAIDARPAFAQDIEEQVPPVTVEVTVEPETVTIGQSFRYAMRIVSSPDVELLVPVASGAIGEFQIVDFGERRERDDRGRVVVERWYDLVGYETGERLVRGPAPRYRVAGSDLIDVEVPDAVVTVASLLPPDPDRADIRDIVGPVEAPADWAALRWLAVAAGTLALAAAALGLLGRRRRRHAPPPTPLPHEQALSELAELERQDLIREGRFEEHYVRLSGIVRRYVERRFGIRAPEMTTEEFLATAQRDPRLPARHRPGLQAFLTEADLVKFARHVPRPQDARRALEAARAFVSETPRDGEGTGRAAA